MDIFRFNFLCFMPTARQMPKTELNNTYPKVCFRIIDTDSHIVLQENVMKTWGKYFMLAGLSTSLD